MTAHWNFEELSRQLVRSIRGHHKQKRLSAQLGFGSNVLYMWESGRRAPELSRFLRMVEICDGSLRVLAFFKEPSAALKSARLTTPRGVQRFVQELLGSSSQSQLAARIGVDRTTLARWVKGQTEPRLPDLLRLVHATTQRLLPFVSCFVDPSELRVTKATWQALREQQRLAYEMPWSHAVLRALELESYALLPRHCDVFLATELGLSSREVSTHLQALSAADQISWTGLHWKLSRILTVDTRQDPARNRVVKGHWNQVAFERLSSGRAPDDALFSYNLFAVSNENLERIHQLHLEYYDAVRALIDESATADRVVLMNVQLVPLGSCSTLAVAKKNNPDKAPSF